MSHSPTGAFNADALIMARLKGLETDIFVVSLASGDHIDHRTAGQAAIRAGFKRKCFYEELADIARLPEEALSKREYSLQHDLSSRAVSCLTAALWEAKCARVYCIQIDRQPADKISGFRQRYAQGERFWTMAVAGPLRLQTALAVQ